jgi:integrase
MAKGKITKTAVEGMAEGWIWDQAVSGFGARRQCQGVFYYLRYRLNGCQRMLSIGRHGSPWTPELARKEALRLLGNVASGQDPSAAASASGLTFAAVAERFLAQKDGRPKTLVDLRRHLRVYAKPLHALALAKVTRRDIAECLARVEVDCGKASRNRLRSSLSEFFTWAISEGLLTDDAVNPVTATRTVDEGGSRKRVLTDDELKAVWHNLGDDRYGDIVRLLLLTGQRREEIGGLRWNEVVSAPAPSTLLPQWSLLLPPERVKNKQEHLLPLSPQAAAIIERYRPSATSPFVFGPEGLGDRPFGGWSWPKAALDLRLAKAGHHLAPWRLHDLRRTAATRMADKLGVLPHVVEAILNHVSGHKSGVAGIYNKALYAAETRDALTRWADYITALTGPTRPKSLHLVRAT